MERLSSSLLDRTKALSSSSEIEIETPHYDRSQLKKGIVHFGPGNFPLAHIADKTHALMQSGDKDALNYGIVTVSINSPDRRDQLKPQDCLYTVVEQAPAGVSKMVVVGSVVDALFAGDQAEAVIAQLASAETRIISMTITPQAHQSYMDANGNLNLQHPDIANDLNPQAAPKTIFGFIARGIQKREANGLPGFTLMNLDNMEHNGEVLKQMTAQFVAAFAPDVTAALETKYSFPNSMVDRIVPKTTPALLEMVQEKAGFIDASAVPAEPMPHTGSWVIEDNFTNGRPTWEHLRLAQIVPDVLPYEKMKLRILNVSHSFMANLGDLAGLPYIDQTMNDPFFKEATLALMNHETGPTLPEVPGIDLRAYKEEIVDRFANPQVQDTTWRVSKDAPLQVVLDSARDQIANNGTYELLALNTAAWMRRFGVDTNELGGKIDAVHPMADALRTAAKAGGTDPMPMFAITEVFGNIRNYPDFVEAVGAYMESLATATVRDTIGLAGDASLYTYRRSQKATKAPTVAPLQPIYK